MKQLIELAVVEARMQQSMHIGVEHLLLALAAADEGPAAEVLHYFAVDHEALEAQLTRWRLKEALQASPKPKLRQALPTQPHIDLTAAADKGTLESLVGREQELVELIQMVCRRTKHNVLLVGKPGVGKRTLVKGLANG